MEKEKKILVNCITIHLPKTRKLLEDNFRVAYEPEISREKLIRIIPEFHGVIANLQTKYDKNFIDNGKLLKLISTSSTGTDHIDMRYAESKGIVVQSLKNEYKLLEEIPSTAEQAFLLMLAAFRNLTAAFNSVCAGNWTTNDFRGRQIYERTLGIIGYGRLGRLFSQRAHAFGMKIIACDPYKTISDPWVKQVSFDELLKHSEVISIHVHLNKKTRGLIGKKEFAKMRDGVYIVNTSRGALIDEVEFLRALMVGKVKCAGIDVLADELDGNISKNPLVEYARTHDNLIISPHVGGCTYDAQEKSSLFSAQKVVEYFYA